VSLRTSRGQEIELYPATAAMRVEKREHGRIYRLCQILPAVPQRIEWVRLDNIVELTQEERDRLRRTPRPQSSRKSASRADGRIEVPTQDKSQDQSRKAA